MCIKKKEILRLVTVFFISRMILFVMGVIFNRINEQNISFPYLLCQWDSGWYYSIIINGYSGSGVGSNQANWVFFPLYPMLVRFVVNIFRFSQPQIVGVFVSNILIFVAAIYSNLYVKLTRKELNPNLPGYIMFLGPWTFYFSSLYTESLFVLLLIMFFYYVKSKKYLCAGVVSALASATKVIGVLFVFVLFAEMVYDYLKKKEYSFNIIDFILDFLKHPEKILAILLCPMGTFAFMYYLYIKVGDAWAYKNGQIAWGRGNNGLYQMLNCIKGGGTWEEYIIFTAIVLTLFSYLVMLKKGCYSEGLFVLITSFIPLISGIYSMPRYFVGEYFIFINVAEFMSKNRWRKMVMWVVFIGLECMLVYHWMEGRIYLI